MSNLQYLKALSYQVKHEPGQPEHFEFRLASIGSGKIDGLQPHLSKDIITYGETFEQAAEEALKERQYAWRNRIR